VSNETLFYIFGAALVVGALVISFLGIRAKEFPPRAALIAVTALFAVVVVGTTTYSVLNAQDEQEHREHELAAEEGEANAEEGGGSAQAGGGTILDIASPEDGSLSFEPSGLEATAGDVTINYDNPSPVGHNVAVEVVDETDILGESDTITASTTSLELQLDPGEYVFFCTVPGHREGGMEGDLTVSGPES
jgi:plastocyanin